MATAVIDIDFEQIPEQLSGLHKYTKALVLVRLRGRPIGQSTFTITDGRISGTLLRDRLLNIGARPYWEQYLHDYLAWDPEHETGFVPPTTTIAICTRDRPEDLARCLQAISLLPDAGQEVLVIDNCPSTDATRDIVAGQRGVRYVREDRPGLNNARNRALNESSHEILAFVDDDAAPDSGWLRALLHNFEDPLVYCVTGLTMPLELETDAQEMHERWSPFGRGYKRRVFDGVHCNPLAAGQVGAGANMAVRRRVFEDLGPFDEALDAGTITRSGGDTEMFARILINGLRIVYEPKALCWHRHRRTWEELRKMFYGHGVGVYAFLARTLFIQGEFGSLKIAWDWFRYDQLPSLVRSLLGRPSSRPLDLILEELRGCLAGPWAYRTSRKNSGRVQS
ncbi:MAG TPA: glycosyltransferase [Nitrospiraceae bacterium]|nr:glycosyltransferase [Nitrospiraceae bacterium]